MAPLVLAARPAGRAGCRVGDPWWPSGAVAGTLDGARPQPQGRKGSTPPTPLLPAASWGDIVPSPSSAARILNSPLLRAPAPPRATRLVPQPSACSSGGDAPGLRTGWLYLCMLVGMRSHKWGRAAAAPPEARVCGGGGGETLDGSMRQEEAGLGGVSPFSPPPGHLPEADCDAVPAPETPEAPWVQRALGAPSPDPPSSDLLTCRLHPGPEQPLPVASSWGWQCWGAHKACCLGPVRCLREG